MEEKHYDFFQNKLCEFYPCHPGAGPRSLAACSATVPVRTGRPVRGSFRYTAKRGQGLYPLPPAPCPGELWEDFGEDAGDFGASEEKRGGSPVHNCRFSYEMGPAAKVAGQNSLLQSPVEPVLASALQQALVLAFDYDATCSTNRWNTVAT